MALLYHTKFRGMLHLARHDQRKMLAYLEIPRFLNPHLTSDSSVDSSRDPFSYKAESGGKRSEHMTKGEKIFSRNKSHHVPTTNTHVPFFGGNLQLQFKELHMVRLSQASYNTFFIPRRVPWDGRSGATWIHRSQWPPLTGQQVNKWPQEFPMGGPRRLIPSLKMEIGLAKQPYWSQKRQLSSQIIYKPTFIWQSSCAINYSAMNLAESKWLSCLTAFTTEFP